MIKSIVTAAIVAFGFNAAADQQTICSKWFECGVFVSHDRTDDQTGKPITTTITINETGPNTATFDYVLSEEGMDDSSWNLIVTFDDKGRFDMETAQDGRAYASGICSGMICSYGMHPFPLKDGTMRGNAGMLSFEGGGMKLLMVYGTPSTNANDLQNFSKMEIEAPEAMGK